MKDFKTIEKFFEVEEAIDYLKKCRGLFIDPIDRISDEDLVIIANSVYSLEEYVKTKEEK